MDYCYKVYESSKGSTSYDYWSISDISYGFDTIRLSNHLSVNFSLAVF